MRSAKHWENEIERENFIPSSNFLKESDESNKTKQEIFNPKPSKAIERGNFKLDEKPVKKEIAEKILILFI